MAGLTSLRREAKLPGRRLPLCTLVVVTVVALSVCLACGEPVHAHAAAQESAGHAEGADLGLAVGPRLDRHLERFGYAYSTLDAHDRRCYRIMLTALLGRGVRDYPADGEESLSRIRMCVVADHPELFSATGVRMNIRYNQLTDVAIQATVEGVYCMDPEEAAAAEERVRVVADAFLSTVPEGADDYAKAKLAYEFVVRTVEYDHEAARLAAAYDGDGKAPGQSLDDALVGRRAVCAGYSAAYQYLMQRMGLRCVQMRGTAGGEAHAWCAACLDGEWYYIDPTWGDPEFLGAGAPTGDDVSYVNYDYLAVTSDDIASTHVLDALFAAPACDAAADNYFVREGLVFDWPDSQRLGALVSEAEADGRAFVQVRCSSGEAYRGLLDDFVSTGDLGAYVSDREYRFASYDPLRTITVFP